MTRKSPTKPKPAEDEPAWAQPLQENLIAMLEDERLPKASREAIGDGVVQFINRYADMDTAGTVRQFFMQAIVNAAGKARRRSMKKANKRAVTVQHFLRRNNYREIANHYAFDLAALKRMALFAVALSDNERMIDKALAAVGLRTDEEQKTAIHLNDIPRRSREKKEVTEFTPRLQAVDSLHIAATITGASMVGDNLLPGDTAIIRRVFDEQEITPGRICCVELSGRYLVKHVYLEDGSIRLVSSNPAPEYAAVTLPQSEVKIIGILTKLERDIK